MNNWNKIYEKCNNQKYSRIVAVKEEKTLHSSIKNFLKGKALYIFLVLLILAFGLLYIFQNNIKLAFYSFVFLIFILLVICYNTTYTIKCTKKDIHIKMNFQDTILDYSQLLNIYLENKIYHFFFIPIKTYNLNIIYKTDSQKATLWRFPTIFLKEKHIIKFFNNFAFAISEENIEETKKEDVQEKKAKHIMFFIVLAVIIVGAVLGYFLFKN